MVGAFASADKSALTAVGDEFSDEAVRGRCPCGRGRRGGQEGEGGASPQANPRDHKARGNLFPVSVDKAAWTALGDSVAGVGCGSEGGRGTVGARGHLI